MNTDRKPIHINAHYRFADGEPDSLLSKYRRLKESGLLFSAAVPLPRSHDSIIHASAHPIPDYTNAPPVTFAEASESRVQDLIAQANTNDLPIVAMYSGGIDSTVLLSSLLRYLPADLRKRLVVRMSNASYAENPLFFKNFIEGKIQFTSNRNYDYTNAIIVHGDPADALWIGGNILNLSAMQPGVDRMSLASGKDILLKFIAGRTDLEFAEWLYDSILHDASTAGFNLDNINDFFWWMIFDYNFGTMILKHIGETHDPTAINYGDYVKNFFPWYASDAYQFWSIQAQAAGTKFDGSLRSYKMEAKEYIYEFDKNQWYRDYKTKVHSPYSTILEDTAVSVLYNNGDIELNG